MPLVIAGATSGSTTVQATDAVTATITLPSATDTLVGKATTDTLTNKTLTLPVVGTTIGVGGATPSASGAGITFPATQSASTNANTLDDYEEGTFTPILTTTGTGFTSGGTGGSTGKYTKIGNLVSVTGTAVLNGGTSGGTGDVLITGLPFTVASVDYPLGTTIPGRVTLPSLGMAIQATVLTTTFGIARLVTAANATAITAANVNGNSSPYFGFSLVYQTS
jgi:hypothetical protein